MTENWWREHHHQEANVRARAEERNVYQAKVDAANQYGDNYAVRGQAMQVHLQLENKTDK